MDLEMEASLKTLESVFCEHFLGLTPHRWISGKIAWQVGLCVNNPSIRWIDSRWWETDRTGHVEVASFLPGGLNSQLCPTTGSEKICGEC